MYQHFPNSNALSSRIQAMLKVKGDIICSRGEFDMTPNVIGCACVCLECGGDWAEVMGGVGNVRSSFERVLNETFKGTDQNARSAFQVLKWSFLSKIAPLLFKVSE